MLTLTASLLLSLNSGSLAGRADVPQERYAQLAEPFEAVGTLGGLGTGTLISERWVITAAHVADYLRMQGQDPIMFSLSGGRAFEVDQVIIHPRWKPLEEQMANKGEDDPLTPGDLALMRLAEPAEGVEPIPMGAFNADHPEIMMVGIGAFFDDPANGAERSEVMGMERGTRHAGTNRVDRVDERRDELIISFTAPGEEDATEFEASAFAGDSGGPILSQTDEGWAVVGIIAAVDSISDNLGGYGDVTKATSVGAVRSWIDRQMMKHD